jgi:hypothetical protein
VFARQPPLSGPTPGMRPKKFDIVRAADWAVALVTSGLVVKKESP